MSVKTISKICVVIALTMAASSVFGATTISGTTVIGGGTFSPSNKVDISVDSTATVYSAHSKHLSGDRIMATNNSDPKMYYKTTTTGSSVDAASTSDTYASGWTSL